VILLFSSLSLNKKVQLQNNSVSPSCFPRKLARVFKEQKIFYIISLLKFYFVSQVVQDDSQGRSREQIL
jgi:hypothetical protein